MVGISADTVCAGKTEGAGYLSQVSMRSYRVQSIIEMRNNADKTIKQQVWGPGYVDELVQIAVNDDPTDTEQVCESTYWAMQDAN
jgi:hypothetical protein